MHKIFLIFTLAFLLLPTSILRAEIYQWTDDAGVSHFTDQPHKVPTRYRVQGNPPSSDAQKDTKSSSLEVELLYIDTCSACHNLHPQERYRSINLEELMSEMESEMKDAQMPPLSSKERSAILDYIKKIK